ncbi:MAG TPA: hypothetical protein VFP50_15205 [Anaeromyxobacteraceae bacterium]|nr:hypothetical protein [Anaeromyxobacteraceae bacterium]
MPRPSEHARKSAYDWVGRLITQHVDACPWLPDQRDAVEGIRSAMLAAAEGPFSSTADEISECAPGRGREAEAGADLSDRALESLLAHPTEHQDWVLSLLREVHRRRAVPKRHDDASGRLEVPASDPPRAGEGEPAEEGDSKPAPSAGSSISICDFAALYQEHARGCERCRDALAVGELVTRVAAAGAGR